MSRSKPEDELQRLRFALAQQRDLLAQAYAALPSSSSASEAIAPFIGAPLPSMTALQTLMSRPRVGVGVLLRCDVHPGCVLIGERKGSHGAGKWALPGGHLEGGETWAQCAVREVDEETNVKLDGATVEFVTATNDLMGKDGGHYVTIFVSAKISADQAASAQNLEADKCIGWHWLTWEQISEKPVFLPLSNFITGGWPRLLK